ncbi:7-deoxyloganetic acid glucosyltransferase [Sarracenia purpurea var. burkii]
MEHFLRCRDFTRLFGNGDCVDQIFQIAMNEAQQAARAQALILNTFEDLEGPILTHIRSQCPNIYTIGPLHTHLKSRLITSNTSSNSLREEDTNCMTWLESQPLKSVIYVSFGSIAMVTKDQLMEFWHGLVSSGKRFLWAIRPDSIVDGKNQIPTELLEGTKERG